jgi:hypothetical protein
MPTPEVYAQETATELAAAAATARARINESADKMVARTAAKLQVLSVGDSVRLSKYTNAAFRKAALSQPGFKDKEKQEWSEELYVIRKIAVRAHGVLQYALVGQPERWFYRTDLLRVEPERLGKIAGYAQRPQLLCELPDVERQAKTQATLVPAPPKTEEGFVYVSIPPPPAVERATRQRQPSVRLVSFEK